MQFQTSPKCSLPQQVPSIRKESTSSSEGIRHKVQHRMGNLFVVAGTPHKRHRLIFFEMITTRRLLLSFPPDSPWRYDIHADRRKLDCQCFAQTLNRAVASGIGGSPSSGRWLNAPDISTMEPVSAR